MGPDDVLFPLCEPGATPGFLLAIQRVTKAFVIRLLVINLVQAEARRVSWQEHGGNAPLGKTLAAQLGDTMPFLFIL